MPYDSYDGLVWVARLVTPELISGIYTLEATVIEGGIRVDEVRQMPCLANLLRRFAHTFSEILLVA